jgi:trehalose 6-phosphate phosphatase
VAPTVERLRSVCDRAGLFLDFDGTLAEIAPTPSAVAPAPGTIEVLPALIDRFALVAVVTGRPASEVRAFLPVEALEVFGVYGLEGAAAAGSARPHLPELRRIAALVPGAWVEDKGVSLTLHYRQAPDPGRAAEILAHEVEDLASRHGLTVMEGKRALEVASERIPGKGAVISGEVQARGLAAALYAGDDLADLDAFEAMERLAKDGVETVKVAVRSEETPGEVIERADVVVERPGGLVELLRRLTA